MIYVIYLVVGVYGVSIVGGLAVSWLIQRFGTFGSEHGYTDLKPPQNP
jgi:predicted ATP-grasp superfamily ATP-dependent carboligase